MSVSKVSIRKKAITNGRESLYLEFSLEKPCVRDPRSPSAVDPRKQV